MKNILMFIGIILLSGCSWFTKTEYVEVEKEKIVKVKVMVPIACPVPDKLSFPILPIHSIVKGMNPDIVVKRYAVSLEMLSAHIKKQEAILDAYRIDVTNLNEEE